MSTKILPDDPGNNIRYFIAFLAISLLLHIVALWAFSLGPLMERLIQRAQPEATEPLPVDVVELPPAMPDNLAKSRKPPTHYAQRSQSVEKETYPEPSARPRTVKPAMRPGYVPPIARDKGVANPAGGNSNATEAKNEALPKDGGKATGVVAGEQGGLPVEQKIDTGLTQAHTSGEGGSGGGGAAQDSRSKAGPRGPNLFITDEKLAELSKKYEAESPSGEKGKTLQLNTSEIRYQRYLLDMKDRIRRFWDYPEIAGRNGWQGTLKLNFTIRKDGTVDDIRLIESSKYPVLDEAAITAIRLAAPFAPFPANFDIEELNIRGLFQYDIYYRPMER
ncbi:MAG: TonB family protein [Deltaproteobacteria bacterium]|nr:TonB family protein [Deltaproteobacteria bacterium]